MKLYWGLGIALCACGGEVFTALPAEDPDACGAACAVLPPRDGGADVVLGEHDAAHDASAPDAALDSSPIDASPDTALAHLCCAANGMPNEACSAGFTCGDAGTPCGDPGACTVDERCVYSDGVTVGRVYACL